MEECGYCKEKKNQIRRKQKFEENIEKEKVGECLKALEREKIAKGMQCTREDEKRLREMQKMQMLEKQCIEREEEDTEYMWHQVLVNDVRRKEQLERMEAERRHREMLERRRTYDEQIASANRKRRETLREERDRERRRLERMRQKMEQDHYEDVKRKKEQQMTNKKNYVEGHQLKILRQQEEKSRDRALDNNTIRVALEELREERLRKRNAILNQRNEEKIFTENVNRERRTTEELDIESEKVALEWRQQENYQTDEFLRRLEDERRTNKEKAVREYQMHLEKLKEDMQNERRERSERMQLVSRIAYRELQRQMDNANGELKKQLEYRTVLKDQICDNQKALETELIDTQNKDWTFTKKPDTFKDKMMNRYNQFCDRESTNPDHPFKKVIETEEAKTNTINLPLLGNKYK